MRHVVVRWMMPFVLALGLVGHAAAHEHDHGGLPKIFAYGFFGAEGVPFSSEDIDFKIKNVASLIDLDIFSIGLSDMTASIYSEKTHLSVYSASFDRKLDAAPFELNPGKYFLTLTGSVSEAKAGYFGFLTASPVPEPSEWALMLAGFAMIGTVVARRR